MKLFDKLFNEAELPEIRTTVTIETASILKLCGFLFVTATALFILHKIISRA